MVGLVARVGPDVNSADGGVCRYSYVGFSHAGLFRVGWRGGAEPGGGRRWNWLRAA